MLKRALKVALICLFVAPVNSYAADAADIDNLITESQGQARNIVQQKLKENQELIVEITKLEEQIKDIQTSADSHRSDMKTNLYIAAGTAAATAIVIVALGRGNRNSEIGLELNYMFKFASFFVGATADDLCCW